MFVIQKWKLYMYPDDLGATFMVIPTSKKYNIKRNLKINTELGMMEVDSNPNRSNPALLYSISEDILTNSFIDKTINYMINLVNNHFDKFEKD